MSDSVTLAVCVVVADAVPLALTVDDELGVCESESVGDALGVLVALEPSVAVVEGVDAPLGVALGVAAALGDGVTGGLALTVVVGVLLAV